MPKPELTEFAREVCEMLKCTAELEHAGMNHQHHNITGDGMNVTSVSAPATGVLQEPHVDGQSLV